MSSYEPTTSDGAFRSEVLVNTEKSGAADATTAYDSLVEPNANLASKPTGEPLLTPSGDFVPFGGAAAPVLESNGLYPLSTPEPVGSGIPTRDSHVPNVAGSNPTNTRISAQLHSEFSLQDLDQSNFARNAQWCVDGRAILVVCEDASVEVLSVGDDVEIKPNLRVKYPAPVLSTTWFPSASPVDPASYCFVAAVRDCPVKLIDASDGRLRASYRIVDHRERFVAPHCMAFNMYMNKLYCGFEDAIEVFDVHCPGAEGTRLHTVPTKKSRDGLKGIVSALAFAPEWSGLYAAGSYSGGIAMYAEETGSQAQGWLEGADGGVTQIKFNPTQPHLVHAAFRRSSKIATWDVRNPSEPVGLFDRGVVRTNQRLWFDVNLDGRLGVAGDEVSVFGSGFGMGRGW
ncbi:hypothetical protein FRC08_001178 [Ceratobasidium sp. 394]|nr:hypothetical protein FRC08_001178 [Ceratobasidium sp. 394]